VPRYWNRNRLNRTARVSGTTTNSNLGLITARPSTAESTDMAGVIIASPKKNAAPIMPRASTNPPFFFKSVSTRTTRERMPPSPLLSARMSRMTYFSPTTRIRAQTQITTTRTHNGVQGFAHGVKRTGADVAKDHADGRKGQFVFGRRRARILG
jgi:hypothetical protein